MSVARHTMWAFVGLGGQQFVRFVIMIVLARLLTPSEFGVIAGAQIFIALSQGILDFGLGTALIQAKEVDREIERSAMTVVALTSAAIALVLVVGRSAIAASMGIPDIALVLPWLAAGLFLQGMNGTTLQLMFREFRFREVAVLQVLSYVLGYGVVSIILAATGWSYWSIVFGSLAQTVIQLVSSYTLRPLTPTFRPAWKRLRHVMQYGSGVLVSTILNTLARKADNWVAGRMLGAAALGYYSRGYAIMDMANQVPGMLFKRLLLPYFARSADDGHDRKRAARQFYSAHVAGAAISMPATVATMLLAKEIVLILLGAQWRAVIPVLSILGAGLYFRLAYKISGSANVAFGGVWQAVTRQLIYAGIVVIGSLVGARYGLEGIAFAVLLALGWQFWALTNLAFRQTGATWGGLGAALLPVIAASAASGAGGMVVRSILGPGFGVWTSFVVVGIAVGAPYALVLWLFRRSPHISQLGRLASTVFTRDRLVIPSQDGA